MNNSESGSQNCIGMMVGILVIIVSFFGGFMLLLGTDDLSAGQVIFYMMVIPAIGGIVGIAILLYSMKINLSGFNLFSEQNKTTETSYIHVPPSSCDSCKADLSSENIEWVGPLRVKCPYCGATHPTEKRKV